MYNPLIHKKPYGATAQDKETTILFPLDCSMGVKRVFVVLRKVYGEGGECVGEDFKYELPYLGAFNSQDVFKGAFALKEWGVYKYRFEGELNDGNIAFFGRDFDGSAIRGDWLPEWQLTVSKVDYKTPDWAKQGVIYQIFADRFCKVGETPFEKNGRLHEYWNDVPDIQEPNKDYQANDYFGGNVKGIISRLDYLADLGVGCIYLNPIFLSYSNHRYDTADYLQIDPLFGTEEEFKQLIKKADEHGIKIMLDGVFNHTGADSVYFNKMGRFDSVGAYQSKESPYYDWYYFIDYPYNYHAWWGSMVVPTVNKSAEGYRKLILGDGGVIDKWTKLGVKGWRLDVVDELPIDFTTDLCQKIKTHGEDMLVVGEVWEDASTKVAYSQWRPYFMGEQLDSVMNYPFKEAIINYTLDGDKSAFVQTVSRILENYPKQSLDVLMNLIDSHDTVRAITRLGNAPAPSTKRARAQFRLEGDRYVEARNRLKFASTLQYTLPGVPCLYYGDEAGTQGFEDPLNRATYPWGREDMEIVEHYKQLGNMRKQHADLLMGETVFENDDDLLVFTRTSEKGVLRVLANKTSQAVERKVDGIDAITNQKVDNLVIEPNTVKIIVKYN